MRTHTCKHEYMYVLTPSFWLVARVPLHLASPFPYPSMFLSMWWAVCCVICVVGFLYTYMYIYTCACTYKIVISMRLIPPTVQMFLVSGILLCAYIDFMYMYAFAITILAVA